MSNRQPLTKNWKEPPKKPDDPGGIPVTRYRDDKVIGVACLSDDRKSICARIDYQEPSPEWIRERNPGDREIITFGEPITFENITIENRRCKDVKED